MCVQTPQYGFGNSTDSGLPFWYLLLIDSSRIGKKIAILVTFSDFKFQKGSYFSLDGRNIKDICCFCSEFFLVLVTSSKPAVSVSFSEKDIQIGNSYWYLHSSTHTH
jgi:hypothetical protein